MECSRCGKELNKNSIGLSRFEMHEEVFDEIKGYHYKWNKEKKYLCSECTFHFKKIFMNRQNYNASRIMMKVEYGE